jgi:hypothetical protein
MDVTVIGGDIAPERSMRRTRNDVAFASAEYSIQLAAADPSGSSSTSTRPSDISSSRRTGFPNVRPASSENATNACPCSSCMVNQAIATRRPLALKDGPFTGQAGIFQLSL